MASDSATSISTGNGDSDVDLAVDLAAGLAAAGAAEASLAACAAGAGLAACAAGAEGGVGGCGVDGWKAPGTARNASHFSASILARATWPVSDGALPSSRASVPVAVSPPIDILKSVTASRVGAYSMPPSKVKLPTTEPSKTRCAWPGARPTASMESVTAPPDPPPCPFT